jgi:multiple sugar transport system permease protein
VVFVAPLILLVTGSLHQPGLPPPPTPDLVPDPVTTEGYGEAIRVGGLFRAGLNSLIVAVIAVPVSVLVAALAGFALTQLPRRVAGTIVLASLVALMVPATALLVPKFTMFRLAGLIGSVAPLLAPALLGTSPLYVLIYYLAFRTLPAELYELCQIEDLSPMQTWWRMAMPLARPVTAAVAALSFVITWSNFLDPLVFLYDRERYTLPLALRSLATLDPTNFPVFLAGAVFTTIPALLVFAIAQRHFGNLGAGLGRQLDASRTRGTR